jgi:glutamate-1-semialdehyde 2,1-aminomutase
VGKAEILDMIQHRGDPEWDARRRVAHPGTFNANPLSAVAGATCLEILDREPVNERVEAMTERLRSGLNGVLARMGIPGLAYGLSSGLFVALGVEGEWDEANGCTVPDARLKAANDPTRGGVLRKALLNEGVDIQGGTSWRLTGAHTEEDVDFTVEAYAKALRALMREGWPVSGVTAEETAAR